MALLGARGRGRAVRRRFARRRGLSRRRLPRARARPAERLLPRRCWRSPPSRRSSTPAPTCASRAAAGAAGAAFLLALAGLLAARDVTTFLAFWELMTLVPGGRDPRRAPRRARCARRSTPTSRSRTSAAPACGSRCCALAGASATRAAAPAGADARRDRRAGRLRHQGGARPAAHAGCRARTRSRPRPFSALMSGVMVKVALYGLIRVEFEWLGAPPRWLGLALLGRRAAVGAGRRAVGARAARPQAAAGATARSRTSGSSCSALGASMLFARCRVWAALAFAAALLHIANHAVFKALLFLGAGAFERAAGALELDRLGGLLRRMPWTGARVRGRLRWRSPGVPPLNGFASEWLTLQALAHLALRRAARRRRSPARAALAGLAATAALALLCFVKVAGLVLLGRAAAAECAAAVEAPLGMRAALVVARRRCASSLGLVPGLARADARRPRARATSSVLGDSPGSTLPGHRLAAGARARRSRSSSLDRRCWCALRGTPPRRARADLGLRAAGRRRRWTGRRRASPSRCGWCSRRCCARGASSRSSREGGVVQRIRYTREVASPADRAALRAGDPRRAARRRARAPAADRQRAHLRRLPARAGARPAGARAHRGARMSSRPRPCSSPASRSRRCCPARSRRSRRALQGRRGASPLQPYRTLRRLWGKSAVDPLGTGPVYRARAGARRRLPARRARAAAGRRALRRLGLGNDALVLVGLLALARFALAAAAWDTGNGFALMGAARDLDARRLRRGAARARAAARRAARAQHRPGGDERRGGGQRHLARAGALVRRCSPSRSSSLAETGRQPVDNPDTHLELTMIHEGPLLEYAGRDLAYLQWAAAARHWVVLVLAAELFLPHCGPFGAAPRAARRRAASVLCVGAGGRSRRRRRRCGSCACPALLGLGRADRARRRRLVARGGAACERARSSTLVLALGLGVVVVRRRSVAIALVAAQSLALGIGALDARRRALGASSSSPALVLLVKAVALPALLLAVLRRTREPRLVRRPPPARCVRLAGAARRRAGRRRARAAARHSATRTPSRPPVALVLVGIAIVVARRPALFQLLGLIVAENGLSLLAISVPGRAAVRDRARRAVRPRAGRRRRRRVHAGASTASSGPATPSCCGACVTELAVARRRCSPLAGARRRLPRRARRPQADRLNVVAALVDRRGRARARGDRARARPATARTRGWLRDRRRQRRLPRA